ncbi:hypothetical protein AaE_000280 [Aphanomyces astaci]|uniref:Uncharacterized protein n=1 Tax=Aphanomyces astaci TaxID=112090 RepID=A0A6A5B097_APHAT|nr:hypothetical protein AaE_000280 [Aphanomyces astaci]
MQESTPDPYRHLSFLSPDETQGLYALTSLHKWKHKPVHPNQDSDDDSDDANEEDSPIPTGSKRKRAKRAIGEELDPQSDKKALSTPRRIDTNVVILKQPPSEWYWCDDHSAVDFYMHVGLVASDNHCELLPLEMNAFGLWLMNEDGNGVFGHFKLHWTSQECATPNVMKLHVSLAVDTHDLPTQDDQIIRIHISYSNSELYNAHPMESDDISVRPHQLYATVMSPISATLSDSEPSLTASSPCDPLSDLSFILPLPHELPSTSIMLGVFATAPADFVVNWASGAASLLRAIESIPVAGTLLNQCPMCQCTQSLELPMIHSTTCSLKELLLRLAQQSWPSMDDADQGEIDDLAWHHSLVCLSPEFPSATMPQGSWSLLPQDLSSLSLDSEDTMTDNVEDKTADP